MRIGITVLAANRPASNKTTVMKLYGTMRMKMMMTKLMCWAPEYPDFDKK